MEEITKRSIRSSSGINLAFALVVMVAYFATFSTLKAPSFAQISAITLLGVFYIFNGIYGYGACLDSPEPIRLLVYFGSQITLGIGIVYFSRGAGLNSMILLPLVGHSALLLSSRKMYLVNGIMTGAYIAVVMVYSGASLDAVWAWLPIFFAGQVFIIVFVEMALSEERAKNDAEKLVEELGAANQRLREYAGQIEELTITKERNRLAREIHDGLGHYLTTINMQIKASQATLNIDPMKTKKTLASAQEQTQEALLEIRRSVAALRAFPDETKPFPERIERLLKTSFPESIRYHYQVLGDARALAPEVELTLYRVTQEAVNNILKHSQASQVNVELDYATSPGDVFFRIQDNGVGSDEIGGGFGLIGLQERIDLIGGTFNIETAKEKGFSIQVGVQG